MTPWRVGVALVLAVAVGWPLGWPIAGVLRTGAWPTADTWPRLAVLGRNSGLLLAGTLLLAVPTGVALAVLLERTDLPGRRPLWLAVVATAFVPLPLFASAWQVLFGLGGWLSGVAPWATGLLPAAAVHALAGLPWVLLLVGRGLRAVERDLEEDALQVRGPAWVLCRVSLPRSLGAVAAACLVVGLLTVTEITVTDRMEVPTIAQEVLTQFNLTSDLTEVLLSRAVTAALPGVVVWVLLVLLLAGQAERLVPAGQVQTLPAQRIPLGVLRWPTAAVAWAVGLALLVPLAALLGRAGQAGDGWSARALAGQLAQTAASDGAALLRSLGVAAAAGVGCAATAVVCCWLARESRWFRVALLVLLAVAWATPGPVLGLAFKGVIQWLLDHAAWLPPLEAVLRRLLWDGPSVLPLLWVHVVRLLPFAAALVWPAVHLLPRELLEAARLDGVGPWGELVHVVAPLTLPAAWRAALAVAALSLGELSAGKLVSTPGAQSFAEVVFAELHYGSSPGLAARCLLLLVAVVVAVGAASVRPGWHNGRRRDYRSTGSTTREGSSPVR